MNGKSLGALIGLSFAIVTAGGGFASAETFVDCVQEAASEDLVAKTDFQRGMRDLIVRQRPEFAALATVSMELQIQYAKVRQAKFDYLLKHDPDRIDTANGLSKFTNFEWFDEDKVKFIEESGSYRDLETRLAKLREQNDGNLDWPKMREHFRSELGQSPEFASLMARFQTRQGKIEVLIAQCRRG